MRRVGPLFLLLNITFRISHCIPDGENNVDEAAWLPRVTGGEEAPVGRFPYMCSLRERGHRDHKCGGTLIRSQWILTAAHCIHPQHRESVGLNPIVYCGSHTSETNDPDLIFNAVEGFVHSSWTGNVHDGFDIGLLRLDRESNATLPVMDTHHTPLASGDLLTALGWGSTDSEETASVLQIVENLLFVLPVRCEEELGSIFKTHMICAGLLNQDTCRGDSGGPILLPDRPSGNITAGLPQADLIVGVTSFGREACDGSSPGVYISTSHMWEWIVSVLDGEGSGEESLPSSTSTDIVEEIATPLEGSPRPGAFITSVGIPDPQENVSSGHETASITALSVEAAIPLIEADSAGVLEAILSGGLDPNSRHNDPSFRSGESDDTLLHWAARFDSAACAKVLIDAGAELEAKNSYGATPLHVGAWYGSTNTAKVLLDHGADIEARETNGYAPLHYACMNGGLETVEVFLQYGAEVDARANNDQTPLQEASAFGFDDIIKVLLDEGVDINSVDNNNFTPLHRACRSGHYKAVKVLIRRGADINALNRLKNTPLHLAAVNGNPDVVKVLLNNGADIEAIDHDGETPLHEACKNGHEEVVHVLLSYDANVDAVDYNGQTPLHKASEFGHLGVASIMVDAGASKTSLDNSGNTPLDVICSYEEGDCSERTRRTMTELLSP